MGRFCITSTTHMRVLLRMGTIDISEYPSFRRLVPHKRSYGEETFLTFGPMWADRYRPIFHIWPIRILYSRYKKECRNFRWLTPYVSVTLNSHMSLLDTWRLGCVSDVYPPY